MAKIARLRYPEVAVPTSLWGNFVRMADVAEKMVVSAGQTLNDLRRSQFRALLSDDWADGVEAAVDVALLGRYYVRIADDAASMGRRIIYVVTGEFPSEDFWPQP